MLLIAKNNEKNAIANLDTKQAIEKNESMKVWSVLPLAVGGLTAVLGTGVLLVHLREKKQAEKQEANEPDALPNE